MNEYPIWFCLALLLSCLLGICSGWVLAFIYTRKRLERKRVKKEDKANADRQKTQSLRNRLHRQDSTSFSAFRSFEKNHNHPKIIDDARKKQDDSYTYISKMDHSNR